MALTLNDVKCIAHLARIEIEADEAQAMLEHLSGIFRLIEDMQAVSTDGVEPMSHAQNITLRLRDDEVTEVDQRGLFQSIAPQTAAGLYLVPKVVE